MSKNPIYRLTRILRAKLGNKDDMGPINVACIHVPDILEVGDEMEITVRRVRLDGAVVRETIAVRLTHNSQAEIYDLIATDHPRAKLADEAA